MPDALVLGFDFKSDPLLLGLLLKTDPLLLGFVLKAYPLLLGLVLLSCSLSSGSLFFGKAISFELQASLLFCFNPFPLSLSFFLCNFLSLS